MKGFLIIDGNKNSLEVSPDEFSDMMKALGSGRWHEILVRTRQHKKRTELYDTVRKFLEKED